MAVAKKSTKRRILVIALVVVGLLALVVGIIGRPTTNLASTLLTETVRTGDVSVNVSASGTIVDEATYTISAVAAPVLAERAGVAVIPGSTTSGSAGSTTKTKTVGPYTTTAVVVSPGDVVASGQELIGMTDANGASYGLAAPFAGVIRTVTTSVGATAGDVMTMGSGAQLVSVNVSEHDVAKVIKDQTVQLTLGATKEVFAGTVKEIGELADSTTGVQEYQVLIASEAFPKVSRVGMSVSASIEISSAKNVLYVSSSAVTTANGVSTVRVLEGNRVRVAAVTLGVVGDSRVEIKSGLRAGDVVVTGSSGTVPVVSTTGNFPRGGN